MRSKTLCAANILSTIYSLALLWIFGEGLFSSGDLLESMSLLADISRYLSDYVIILYVVILLLIVHIGFITLGTILGWLAFATKKSGPAKTSAILYLLATICFPIYIIFGLPITIVGFIGAGKQKQINISVGEY